MAMRGIMQNIRSVPTRAANGDVSRPQRGRAASGDRAAASRARELLAMLAALIVVAGVGALMVACTQL
jgi:hypothetical protein